MSLQMTALISRLICFVLVSVSTIKHSSFAKLLLCSHAKPILGLIFAMLAYSCAAHSYRRLPESLSSPHAHTSHTLASLLRVLFIG